METFSPTLIMVLQLVACLVLAMPVVWNREQEGPSMGLRTFPLVALGSCAYVLIGLSLVDPDEHDSLMRIMQCGRSIIAKSLEHYEPLYQES